MNKKLLSISALALALIIIVGAVSMHHSSQNANTITIGAILPLSGDKAAWGTSVRDSMQLAISELATTNSQYTYRLVVEDNQLDNAKSASAAHKLIEVDHADALITLSSGTGNTINPIAEAAHVPHVGIAADQNIAKGIYNFIHWTPPAPQATKLIEQLRAHNITRVGVFELNQQGMIALVTEVRKQIAGTNIQIVSDQKFNSGEKDFRAMIAKAQQDKPEIYLLEALSPELEVVTKQLKEMNVTTPITSISAFETSKEPQLFEGYWYIAGADANDTFTSAFDAAYHKPLALGAPNAYDIVKMIAASAEQLSNSDAHDGTKLAAQLQAIRNFSGALGVLSVNDDGIVLSGASVHMITNGKPVSIK